VESKHHKKETKVERRKIEQINQFGISHIYTWKRYNETPCIAILKKQKWHFFYKNREQESKAGPLWEVVTSGMGEDIRKRCWRANTQENCENFSLCDLVQDKMALE
jgi:hypothetical protein